MYYIVVVMGMASRPPKEKKPVISVRLEPQYLQALDAAVQLGLFRSRTEAISLAVERMLHDLYFISQATRMVSQKQNGVYTLHDIFKYLSQASALQKVLDDFSAFIPPILVVNAHKKKAFDEFYSLLETIFEEPSEQSDSDNGGNENVASRPPSENPTSENKALGGDPQ